MKNDHQFKNLYRTRPLAAGYPSLEEQAVAYKAAQEAGPGSEAAAAARVDWLEQCLDKLVNLSTGSRTVLVIGCGPAPWTLKTLLNRGYDACGLEPDALSSAAAAAFIGDPARIYRASAESLPLEDGSQRFVLMESVLEHVDSPPQSLAEAHRVLEPQGVLFVVTTNKHRFSLVGENGEYRVKFYNWLPALVKECYVHQHLHYDPSLANFSVRPAVHWFTYSTLCQLGRQAGFGKFYSYLDLIEAGSHPWKKYLFQKAKYHVWLRALILTQLGGSIFMLKRPR